MAAQTVDGVEDLIMKLPSALLKNIRQGALTVASAGIALGLNGCGLVETSLQKTSEEKAPQPQLPLQPIPPLKAVTLTPEQLSLFEKHFAAYMKGDEKGEHFATIVMIGKLTLPLLEQKFSAASDPADRAKIQMLIQGFTIDPCPPCGMG